MIDPRHDRPKSSTEQLTVVIWSLMCRMTNEQIEAACDDLQELPVARDIQALLRAMRETAARDTGEPYGTHEP